MSYGKDYLPNESLVNGIWTNEMGLSMGLENGDKIVSIGDAVPESYREIPMEILLSQEEDIVVERAGNLVTVPITMEAIEDMISNKKFIGLIKPRMPYVIGALGEESAGGAAGLTVGDSIVGLNGQELLFFDQYKTALPKLSGEQITLSLYREGRLDSVQMVLPESGQIGVYNTGEVFKYYEIKNKAYTCLLYTSPSPRD